MKKPLYILYRIVVYLIVSPFLIAGAIFYFLGKGIKAFGLILMGLPNGAKYELADFAKITAG